jgi:carboxypeptidase T
MRSVRAKALGFSAMLIMVAVMGAAGANAAGTRDVPGTAAGGHARQAPTLWEIRVVAPSVAQVAMLAERDDLLELRAGADYFVLGDVTTVGRLQAQGLRAELERPLPNDPAAGTAYAAGWEAAGWEAAGSEAAGSEAAGTDAAGTDAAGTDAAAGYPTFYGGYHTVEAHWSHLAKVAEAHPDLAKVVTYGSSWRASQGLSGDSLQAICLTKLGSGDCALTPQAPKPRAVLVTALHAREIATAEIAWNWIDLLATSYGQDSAVTALLDSTEVWVIPLANPDGSRIVESGGGQPLLQRKNADNADGAGCADPPTGLEQSGVDLNRNFGFDWGDSGASAEPCSQDYHGTQAASEPETQALQTLFRQLFADRRGSSPSDPAPADTTGTVFSYHSYAGMVLYPWAITQTPAPNQDKLVALAEKLAQFNNYSVGTPADLLGAVSGSLDDFVYGDLGVPSLTTELGGGGTDCDGFTPPYSCVADEFWPQESQALMVMAQAAAGPYR